MNPILIDSNTNAFSNPVAAKEPVGEPVAKARIALVGHEANDEVLTGVWESTPGSFRRKVLDAEFSHFVAGKCTFTPDNGEPIEIKAGDAVYFPANSTGIWDVKETVRKTFVIIK